MRLQCPVRSIEYFNTDTRQLLLEIPAGSNLEYKAGQYLELILPEKNCPFSIANAPGQSDVIELHIRPTDDSSDSVAIEQLLDSQPASIEIDIPKGKCFLEQAPEHPLILLAASTGVTQMKSIIEQVIANGMSQPVYLYWGVLSENDLYQHNFYFQLARTEPLFNYIPVVSEPESSPNWSGRTGLVGDAVLEDFRDLSELSVFVSGGPGMVYATLDAFTARGLPEERMFADVFDYAPRL